LEVLGVRARWLGHRLTAELDVAVDGRTTVQEAEAVSSKIEHELLEHVPALSAAHVRSRPVEAAIVESNGDDRYMRKHAEHAHGDD
jgi:divalent metal cation (Fe/Co/Zn/Cd) transporter